MPVKAGYLFLAGGGAVVIWSGVKGKRATDVFRTLIGGNSPANLPQAYNVTGVIPTPANTNNPGGTPANPAGNSPPGISTRNTAGVPASASESSWISAFLANLGAPASAANVSSVEAWINHEKPAGQPLQWNNPLNIGTPGSTSVGRTGTFPVGPGIAIYDNPTDGARADALFIMQNGYNKILMLLRSGQGLKSGAESELLAWSGGAYSSV